MQPYSKMKKYLSVLLCCMLCCWQSTVRAQQDAYNTALLDTLQQIENSNTASKHFAGLYKKAIQITNVYAHGQPQAVKDFIFGFEAAFGPKFFAAHSMASMGKPVSNVWQAYYADSGLNPLQYQFIGMNAHINGDMYKALIEEYNFDTLKKYQYHLIKFQKAFNTFFDSIYTTTKVYKKVSSLHLLTLGLDKNYGRQMVLRWRKRQVKLALWYYAQPKKFERRRKKLDNSMQRFNRFAIKWLQ
jgi:hypothetical protein